MIRELQANAGVVADLVGVSGRCHGPHNPRCSTL